MAGIKLVGLTLAFLVVLGRREAGVDGFIKAALGVRLGYSPAEKGYGKPLQINDLHPQTPILKGHFLTGVHSATPIHSSGEQHHGHNNIGHGHNNGGHGHDHGHSVEGQGFSSGGGHHGQGQNNQGVAHSPAGNTGLLRHLKILGVNLYLGGPKDSKFAPRPQEGGHGGGVIFPTGIRTPEQEAHLQLGRGPRGQYSPGHHTGGHHGSYGPSEGRHYGGGSGPIVIEGQGHGGHQHHHPNDIRVVGELRGIDALNEIRGSGSGQEGGSGYSFPAGAEVFQPAASQYRPYPPPHLNGVHGEMFQQFITPEGTQPRNNNNNHAPPTPTVLQPVQQQQQPKPHPHSGERPGGPPPPRKGFSLASLMKGPQWASNLFRLPLKVHFGRSPPPHFPHPQPNHAQSHQQQSTVQPHPQQQHNHYAQGSLGSMSSPSLSFSTLYSTNPTPNPPHPQTHSMMPASASSHPTSFQPHPQQGRSVSNPFPGYPYAPGPQNALLLASPSAYAVPGGGAGSSNYFQGQNHPRQMEGPQFFSPEPDMQRYPHPNQDYNRPHPQQGAQTLPEFNRYESDDSGAYQDSPPSGGMPEDMRPPSGFHYSHSETSPIMSMGVQSYDDAPVMMGEEQGGLPRSYGRDLVKGQGQRGGQGPVFQGGSGGPAPGAREISEDEYNSFISAPTNTHSQHTTQIMAPGGGGTPSGRRSFDFGGQQQVDKSLHRRRDHLASSLRNWNPFLSKQEPNISRNYGEMGAASAKTELKEESPPAPSAPVKKWVPIIRRSTTKSSGEEVDKTKA